MANSNSQVFARMGVKFYVNVVSIRQGAVKGILRLSLIYTNYTEVQVLLDDPRSAKRVPSRSQDRPIADEDNLYCQWPQLSTCSSSRQSLLSYNTS